MMKIKNNKRLLNDSVSVYTTSPNQSIYDVAMDVHGSIDGVSDLLINNSGLDVNVVFEGGEEVIFTSAITLDSEVTSGLDVHNIIPTTPPHKHYKHIDGGDKDILMDIYTSATEPEFEMVKDGGVVYIDWGDDSELEVWKGDRAKHMFNVMDASYVDMYRIRLYVDNKESFDIKKLNMVSSNNNHISLYTTVGVESFVDNSQLAEPMFVCLMGRVTEIVMNNAMSNDFGYLAKLDTLRKLELNTPHTTPESMDNLFIGIVNNYTARRLPADIEVKVKPNGEYKQPSKKLEAQNVIDPYLGLEGWEPTIDLEGSCSVALPERLKTKSVDSYTVEGLTLVNLVENGDFSDGEYNWRAPYLTYKKDGLYEIKTTTTANRIEQPIDVIVGHKYYCTANITPKHNNFVYITVGGADGNKYSVVENVSNRISDIIKPENNKDPLRVYHSTGSAYKVGDYLTFGNVQAINLTELFGAGNEPSKEWCDEHIKGYINGTQSVKLPMRVTSDRGKRNLLIDSKTIVHHSAQEDIKNDFYNGYAGYIVDGEKTAWARFGITYNENIIPDTKYTFSVDILYIGNLPKTPDLFVASASGYIKMTGNVKNGEWVRCYRTFTPTSSVFLKPHFGFVGMKGRYYFKNLKLEQSDKPTPWTSAIEDKEQLTKSTGYITNDMELYSALEAKDYIKDSVLYKNVSKSPAIDKNDIVDQYIHEDLDSVYAVYLEKDSNSWLQDGFDCYPNSFGVLGNTNMVTYAGDISDNAEGVSMFRDESRNRIVYKISKDAIDKLNGDTVVDKFKSYFGDKKLHIYYQHHEKPPVELDGDGVLIANPKGTIFIDYIERDTVEYNDGFRVDMDMEDIVSVTNTLTGAEYDISKLTKSGSIIYHPDIPNRANICVEAINNNVPIYGNNTFSCTENVLDRVELTLDENVKDGSFWLAEYGSNNYKLEVDGSFDMSYITLREKLKPSSMYYISLKIKPRVDSPTYFEIGDNKESSMFDLVPNEWNTLSGVIKTEGGGNFRLMHQTKNKYTDGDYLLMSRDMAIVNLTDMFGAGNEPDEDWCKENIPDSFYKTDISVSIDTPTGGNGEVVVGSGMEAVWALINNPEWNQMYKWKITINGVPYHKVASNEHNVK